MSGSSQQNMPTFTARVVDPETGLATQEFWRFLISIWNRTGGTTGTTINNINAMFSLSAGDDGGAMAGGDAQLGFLAASDVAAKGDAFPQLAQEQAIDSGAAPLVAPEPPAPDGALLLSLIAGAGAASPQTPMQQAITVGASPYTYRAPASGAVVVSGGTVSAVVYSRDGATTYTLGLTGGLFPVGAGDTLAVTYTVLPTMAFVQI